METLTISPKFQVVIPKSVREKLELTPGQQMQVFLHDGRIEMVPVRSIKSMRGFLKGIDTNVPRDKDRV